MGRESRPKMSREGWARAALKAMAAGGLSAVSVEPLARSLGVTKGSFYWHYDNRDALIGETMALWERNNAEAVAEITERFPDPTERLRGLFLAAFEPYALGGLLVQLAADRDHPEVKPALERVTRARLAFLTTIYAESGLPADQAAHRALLAYTAYVGLFQLMATAPAAVPDGEGLTAYVSHMVDVLVP